MSEWDPRWIPIGPAYWLDFADDWWLLGIAIVVLVNGGLMIAGALLERRHEKRLRTIGVEAAGILLLSGPPPPGAWGEPHVLSTAIVLTPPPLGRWSKRLHRLIGGYSRNSHRPQERARREALLRLREQAAPLGVQILAGLEMHHINIGNNRTALVATATALNAPPAPAGPPTPLPEALGALPPRPWTQLILALAVLLLLSVAAGWTDDAIEWLGAKGLIWAKAHGYLGRP